MALYEVEYDCLCCGGHFIKKVHHCPIGLCTRYEHYDFCETCNRLITNNFEAQVSNEAPPPQRFLPKPRLRVEGETQ